MAFYGLGLETAIKKLNFEFRMTLKKKGGLGVRSLASIFKQFDANGNKKLDAGEFEGALGQAGYNKSFYWIGFFLKRWKSKH